jgi:hypothetical protein
VNKIHADLLDAAFQSVSATPDPDLSRRQKKTSGRMWRVIPPYCEGCHDMGGNWDCEGENADDPWCSCESCTGSTACPECGRCGGCGELECICK